MQQMRNCTLKEKTAKVKAALNEEKAGRKQEKTRREAKKNGIRRCRSI
jgi:hypothetical protein